LTGISNVVDIYDTTTNTWSTQTLTQARAFATGSASGDYIVVAGGLGGTANAYTQLSSAEIYNVATNAITYTASALSSGRQDLASASTGSLILFGGGMGTSSTPSSTVDVLNVDTMTWTSYPNALSVARSDLAAASSGSVVVFAGGLPASGTVASRAADIFDATTNTWTSNPNALATGKTDLTASSLGSYIAFAGGLSTVGSPATDTAVEVFDTTTKTWSVVSSLSTPKYGLASVSTGTDILFSPGPISSTSLGSNGVDFLEFPALILPSEFTTITDYNMIHLNRFGLASAGNTVKSLFAGGSTNMTAGAVYASATVVVDVYDIATKNTTLLNYQ